MVSSDNILREIQTQNAIVRKFHNGIITLHHPENVTVSDMENFTENYEALLAIQQGEISPFLINTCNVVRVGRAEKKFMTETLPTVASQMAMISNIKNPLALFTVNVYLSLFRPSIPHKLFYKEEDGYKWVCEFLNTPD